MVNVPESIEPDIQILSVEFADDYQVIEVTWVERRNVGEKAFKRESITIGAELLDGAELSDVVDSIHQFVDAGLLYLRSEGGRAGD